MKKTTTKLVSLLIACFMLYGLAVAGPIAAKKDGWNALKKIKMISNIRTYPADVIKVKKRLERGSVVELAPIKAALEKAGITEPVTIELRYFTRLLDRIGTFAPTAVTKDGKTAVCFDSIPLGKRIFASLSFQKTPRENLITWKGTFDDNRPKYMQLYFKDAKGKTRAKVRVSFLKAPR